MTTLAIEMNEDNFDDLITKNEIVFVDFWASWCGPCKSFAPVFEEAASKHPEATFAKVDTEAQQELAGSFGIRSIPTLGVFRRGILLYLQPGAVPGDALEELLTQVQALDMEKVKQEIEEHEKNHSHEHGHECHGCGKH